MMRGAIVGFGSAAQHGHWPAYAASRDVEIVAVVDRTAERRRLAEALSPHVRTFETVDALVSSGLPVDFVDVCTPPALHTDPVERALDCGWHVLCEKPFMIEERALERVRRRAAAAGLAVIPVHNWKYAPIIRCASGVLRSEAIGRLVGLEIRTERLADCTSVDSERPNWRRDPAVAGGGIMMDHGWHAVYLALDWFAEQAVGVRSTVSRPSRDAVEDEATLVVTFPSGEAVIELTWRGAMRRNTMRLRGTRGVITIGDDVLTVTGRVRNEDVRFDRALSAGSHHEDWFAAMLPEVLTGFRSPAASRGAFDEAARCLSIIRQAYQADRDQTRGADPLVEGHERSA